MSGKITGYILKNIRNLFLFVQAILILANVSYPQSNSQHIPEPVFEKISIRMGLPNTTITCILQDYSGYLWLGTENGLVKYDGYSMKVYQPDDNDSGSISSRGIVKIYEDKNKILWIATLDGLNKFNRADDSFTSFRNIPGSTNSINSDSVQCIFEDAEGRLWIGTNEGLNLLDRERKAFKRYDFSGYGVNAITGSRTADELLIGTDKDGLWKFDIRTATFSKYKIESGRDSDKKIGWIQSFCKSGDGKLWMISDHTVTSLDVGSGRFKSYIEFPPMDNRNIYESRSYAYGNIVEDQNGIIWFGFVNLEEGIFYLDEKTDIIRLYQLQKDKSPVSFNNRIFSLYTDYSGIVWAGTLDRGLLKYDRRKTSFQVLKHDPGNPNSLSGDNVYDILFDPKGYVWFLTNRGLDKYNVNKDKFAHYLIDKGQITETRCRMIQDKSGYIWIASTYGLVKFNPDNGKLSYYADDRSAMGIAGKSIFRLIQDHLGYLWIATIHSGLYKYDIAKNKMTLYVHDPEDSTSIHDDKIRTLYEDNSGTLWVGTNYGGLNRFDRENESFANYGFESPTEVHEDNYGNFWVADYFTGLSLVDRKNNRIIENYTQKDGLPHCQITRILEDNKGYLWIGTINGLSKFDIEKRTFKNYDMDDGLPDNNFQSGKPAISPDGKMYFCTSGGVVAFYPDSLMNDPIPPKVVLSGVSLIDRPGEKLNYNVTVSGNGELILPYDQNDLRFDFVGLHFSESSENRYKYMLVNYDKEWIYAGTQRNATYTNLEPGEYVFAVTASNRDGIWNKKGASLKIIINYPWWRTPYAYIFYLLVIAGTIYFTWRMQLKKVKIRHEYELRNLEAEKLQELDEMKTHFFTNISHEFRTPLTLIQGPAKQILEISDDERVLGKAELIYRSAKKLNKLANQLLDITRIESGKMKLQVYKDNIVPVIKDLVASFQAFAEKKQITLKFDADPNNIIFSFDPDVIEKVLNNLLSNALKFTHQGGSVKVSCRIIEHLQNRKALVEISVKDNGIGIPEGQISKIFDRFYQVDNRLTKEYEGSGVGLSLTKELVELHKGQISVESCEGQGSVFTVQLPLAVEQLQPEKPSPIISRRKNKNKFLPDLDESAVFPDLISAMGTHQLDLNGGEPVLLIIEDNTDVRNYLKDILNGSYSIIEAVNGEEGLSIALDKIPDLIISDIMMPGIDGIQLSYKLKSDSKTSHIPLILLTARTTLKDKLEGLETGADDYIMKPFEACELQARIKNLLEQRKRLHEHFKKFGLLDIEGKNLLSIDQKFLQKAVETINEHIGDPEFNVESFSNIMAVSRSLLYKKLVSLTGDPPVELIKRVRLNKAAVLIERNSGNITEISFQVGFSNPSYFTECFRNQFGIPPTKYHQNTAKK